MRASLAESAAAQPATMVPVAGAATEQAEASAADEQEEAAISAPAEDEPVFPDEEAEMAMRSELRARGEAPVAAVRREADDGEVAAPLPSLESLTARLGPEVRGVLDELFRARFTGVRRVPSRALKQAPAKD